MDLTGFHANGFEMVPGVVPPPTIESLRSLLGQHARNAGERGGLRDLFRLSPALKELAAGEYLRPLVNAVLGADAAAVRAILFDKTAMANWKVVWHQDVTIAVREQRMTPGYGPWSVKARIIHVQPPSEILEQMVALRIHLDPCGSSKGPLKVLPGTHRFGKLSSDRIDQLRRAHEPVTCVAEEGDVLMMRPLLLHASSPAVVPGHRRVIHIEYSNASLAPGLQWHAAVRSARQKTSPQ
ncbi:MAG: phytanoyl-CoA dioxygenase [Gemmatimonadales bacterium]|nr:phytanoyl-CoA dioxygenase [Gemmatimonadales bacterium]